MNRTIFRAFLLPIGFLWSGSFEIQAEPAVVSSIAPQDLVEYSEQTPEVQKLIRTALSLTKKKLAYTFGSNSPSKGGMDCSGTVQHTLSEVGLSKLPRTSFDFYQWVKASGKIHPTRKIYDLKDPAFAALKPGDLLFWEGTYATGKRNPPISHVMIYLGTLKKDNQGVVYGASSGRRYRGKKIHGVSVFDFKIPSQQSSAKLIGYGSVPSFLKTSEETVEASAKKADAKRGLFERLGWKKKKAIAEPNVTNTSTAQPVIASEVRSAAQNPDLTE